VTDSAPEIPQDDGPQGDGGNTKNFAAELFRDAQKNLRRARMKAVLDLKIRGKSHTEIAAELKISGPYVSKLLKAALERTAQREFTDATALRTLESLRCDQIAEGLWDKRNDPMVAATLVRVAERRAKLWGIDAPEAMRLLPPPQPATDIRIEDLTVEELEFFQRILTRQQEQRMLTAENSQAKVIEHMRPDDTDS
jgi:hypothetical protein